MSLLRSWDTRKKTLENGRTRNEEYESEKTGPGVPYSNPGEIWAHRLSILVALSLWDGVLAHRTE